MTTRDFDQGDAEVLAEFAGLEITEILDGVVSVDTPFDYEEMDKPFMPWHERVEQWQIQSLLDMVREKGKTSLFLVHLRKELDQWGLREDKSMHEVSDHNDMELVSAPPEAICSAILSMEVE